MHDPVRPDFGTSIASTEVINSLVAQIQLERERAATSDRFVDDGIVAGAFELDCRALKADIRLARDERAAELLVQLKAQVVTRSSYLIRSFEKLSRQLGRMPTSPEELYELKVLILTTSTASLDMSTEVAAVTSLFDELQRLRCSLEDSEARMRWEVLALPSRLASRISRAQTLFKQLQNELRQVSSSSRPLSLTLAPPPTLTLALNPVGAARRRRAILRPRHEGGAGCARRPPAAGALDGDLPFRLGDEGDGGAAALHGDRAQVHQA